jgi:hypothetical protein
MLRYQVHVGASTVAKKNSAKARNPEETRISLIALFGDLYNLISITP